MFIYFFLVAQIKLQVVMQKKNPLQDVFLLDLIYISLKIKLIKVRKSKQKSLLLIKTEGF